jgi:HlyD family secretion protein
VEALKVRAGSTGVLQELPVEAGQRVTPGTLLAKVAQPEKLKATLRIPEVQAKEIAVGQRAQIDTRNGIVAGRVARIDPASVNGTVTVDVQLTGALPAGARPELSVDGTVELERLEDVVYLQRPAGSQPNGHMGLFRLAAPGNAAERVAVKLGRMSADSVEVLAGVQPGDKVIISDMSAHDAHHKIRLH